MKNEKTFLEDTFILVSVLSTLLFAFLTIGLYKGIKLKDNIGNIKIKSGSIGDTYFADTFVRPEFDFSGIGEFIMSIVLWIMISLLLFILFWILETIVILLFLLIAAGLYWIYFRALRLVFKKSVICRGDIQKSLAYGFLYTFLYTSWIYLIIYSVKYYKK